MQSIFPDSVDGDLLNLVHLSNGFRMVPQAGLLQVGDVCRAEAKIVSVTNSDVGKTVKVKGTVLRAGKPVIEVTSAFLYRGRFIDYDNTFELVEETDYLVEIKTDADIGVLQAKEWFEWDDATAPLRPGVSLIFKTQSKLTYKDKSTFSAVTVTGAAYIRNQLKQLKKVATVDSDLVQAHGNVVLGYLQRHGQPLGLPTLFDSGGYTLTPLDRPPSFLPLLRTSRTQRFLAILIQFTLTLTFPTMRRYLEPLPTGFGPARRRGGTLRMWLDKVTRSECCRTLLFIFI